MVYYDIEGSTEDELRAQLDALGPIGYDRYRGDATTNWFVHWNWPGYGTRQCDLTKATVSLEIELILPRWNPPAETPASLVAKWDTYIAALRAHEQGHVDHIAANYRSVLDTIRSATCDTGDASATAALDPLRQYDTVYDASTDHGHNEGATFP